MQAALTCSAPRNLREKPQASPRLALEPWSSHRLRPAQGGWNGFIAPGKTGHSLGPSSLRTALTQDVEDGGGRREQRRRQDRP